MFSSYNELPNLDSQEKIRKARFGWLFAEMDRQSRTQKRQWVSNLLVQCAGILIHAGTSLKARADRLVMTNSHSIPSFQGR